MNSIAPRILLRLTFDAVVVGANPLPGIGPHLPEMLKKRTVSCLEGVIVSRNGFGPICRQDPFAFIARRPFL
ncbi:UNVERIFIED_ORG: hypothetical protein GGI57_001135 [Rhizobium aethiopicum]